MIERHCPPTKFDIKPYATILKVYCDSGAIEYYIQLGEEDVIDWQPISYLFDRIFKSLYEDEEFMKELLAQFQDCERSIIGLAKLIQYKL